MRHPSICIIITAFLSYASANPVLSRRDNECPSAWMSSPTSTGVYAYAATWTVVKSAYTAQGTNVGVLAVKENGGTPQWPIPTVSVSVNDRVRIEVVNEIGAGNPDEQVTLHFHGQHMKNGYVFMDGPEGITQCGVIQSPTKNRFIYDFKAEQAGTFWIHSHDPGQYPKGLRTPFIVSDTVNDKAKLNVEYTDDYTMTVADFWSDFWNIEDQYKQSGKAEKNGTPCGKGVELTPESIRPDANTITLCPALGILVNDLRPGGTKKPYWLKPGTTARFRIINMSAYSQFFIWFQDLPVRVIEIDGVLTEVSKPTDGIRIAPGQRISVLATGKTDGTGTWRISVALDPTLVPSDASAACKKIPSDGTLVALSCYTYSDPSLSSTPGCPDTGLSPGNNAWLTRFAQSSLRESRRLKVPWKSTSHTSFAYPWDYNELALAPLQPPYDRDRLFNIKAGNVHWLELIEMPRDVSNGKDGTLGYGSINQDLVEPPRRPDFPALIEVLREGGHRTFRQTINAASLGETIWLVFQTTRGDHPIHLHGHHFSVLYKGQEDVGSIFAFKKAMQSFNIGSSTTEWTRLVSEMKAQSIATSANPMMRDTVFAELGQFMVLAFVVDNPGVWALHCHNDFHSSTGMTYQVVEAEAELKSKLGSWSGEAASPTLKLATGTGTWNVDSVVRQGWQRNVLQCLDPTACVTPS